VVYGCPQETLYGEGGRSRKVAGEILEGIRYYRKIKGLVNPLEEFKDKITEEDIKALKDETELLKARISEEA
jgi:hypothetical protein